MHMALEAKCEPEHNTKSTLSHGGAKKLILSHLMLAYMHNSVVLSKYILKYCVLEVVMVMQLPWSCSCHGILYGRELVVLFSSLGNIQLLT